MDEPFSAPPSQRGAILDSGSWIADAGFQSKIQNPKSRPFTPSLSRRERGTACIALAAACLAICGCAQTAVMMVWQPAETDVGGIRRLAVLQFRGEGTSGGVARSALVTAFWNTGFYTLVDPSPASGGDRAGGGVLAAPADPAEAIAIGRRLGADAVLVGDVLRYRASDRFSRDDQGDARDEPAGGGPGHSRGGRGPGRRHDEALDRDVTVAMAFVMIDVRTGKVRVDDHTSYHAGGELLNGQSSLPAKEVVLAQLMERCARDVVVMLTPRQIQYPVELPSPSFGAGWSDMRRGNDYAAQGDWGQAEAAWAAALSADPQNHSAMYCLAMAASARSDYPRAVGLLTDAVKIHPSQRYQEALARLQRHRQDYDTVMAQKGDRTMLR